MLFTVKARAQKAPAFFKMRPDQEPSIEFSPMTPDDHPAADHHLPIEPAIVQLLTEIRAQQNPVKGKIGSGLPAKRALGSNW